MRNDPLSVHLASDGAANGTSQAVKVGHYWGHVLQVDGEFEANVTVKGRLSASLGYFPISTLSAPGLVPISHPLHDLVVEVSDYVSGQVVVVYAGYKIR